jgi:hypothetical protein
MVPSIVYKKEIVVENVVYSSANKAILVIPCQPTQKVQFPRDLNYNPNALIL